MEPLRQRFLNHLDECTTPQGRPLRPLAVTLLVLCVSTALVLAVAFPYHRHLGAPLAPLGVLWLFQGIDDLLARRREQRSLAEMRLTALRGVPVTAHTVGPVRRGWCRALITFDPVAAQDHRWLRHLATRWEKDALRPTRFVRRRRTALPLHQTDGYTIYLVDLEMPADYLRGGREPGDPLPCLAEPGETGGVTLLPWWLVFPIRNDSPPVRRGQQV